MASKTISDNGHNKDATHNNFPAIEHDNVDAYVREYVTGIIKEVNGRENRNHNDYVPHLIQCCDGPEPKQNNDGPEQKHIYDGPEPKEMYDGPEPKPEL